MAAVVKVEFDVNCSFCFGNGELRRVFDVYESENKSRTYAEMIAECFEIELADENITEHADEIRICEDCIRRLDNAAFSRLQIQSAYARNQNTIKKLNKQELPKEETDSNCCCCFGRKDLVNMLEPQNHEGKVEIYAMMIAECFRVELKTGIDDCHKYLYVICKNCVNLLKDAVSLRFQIENNGLNDTSMNFEVKQENSIFIKEEIQNVADMSYCENTRFSDIDSRMNLKIEQAKSHSSKDNLHRHVDEEHNNAKRRRIESNPAKRMKTDKNDEKLNKNISVGSKAKPNEPNSLINKNELILSNPNAMFLCSLMPNLRLMSAGQLKEFKIRATQLINDIIDLL